MNPKYIRVINNGKITLVTSKNSFTITLESGFMILEVYGDYMGEENKLLAFTSPIYIK